ncbi:MAG: FtsX-like permease family protein [Anaerolineae bacterium]|nr:FtsX-like permease family protein [Anaerolineae bacterium]
MPLRMIVHRMWRERRLLGVLLIAICLVTAFFSLGPLYVQAVSEAGLRYAVEGLTRHQLDITLSNSEPFGPETWALLNQELRGGVTELQRSARSAGVVNGYEYALGEPLTIFARPTPNDYLITAYSNLQEIFTLVDGRWPERLPPPTAGLGAGLSAEEQAANQVGLYSRGQVEAVVAAAAAREARIEVGNRLVIGAEPTGPTAIVHIVGLVEPVLPLDDPFWDGQRLVVQGQHVQVSLTSERFDFGLIVPEGAFDDWIAPATRGNTYLWTLRVDPAVIHTDTLDALEERLSRLQSALRARYPDILIFSGLFDLIAQFRTGLVETEGPTLLLSGAVMVLMLYHLVTTVALVLEQQNAEWASIASRGGSVAQLIGMQALTMGMLGAIGMVAGPFIAQGMLLLLGRVGPLARVLPGAGSLPARVFGLSAMAALAAIVVLTLPAWPAARRSLLRLKQLISRPPTHPIWARYFLDIALLLIGLALLLRLYFLVGGDAAASLGVLWRDPTALIRQIASSAAETGGLNDPFNLLAPALFLTGAALLWLRVFPLLMRLIRRLFRADNGLTVPLALWTVERDPGHYGQLVLLLIGTLALGTASLALEATRDAGAWAAAHRETGASARLEFDPVQVREQPVWGALPGVTAAQSLLVTATPHRAGQRDTTVFGVEPSAFAASFPAWAEAVAPLQHLSAPSLPGLPLPEDAVALTLQVYADPTPDSGPPTETQLAAELIDALGIPLSLALTTVDPAVAGRFALYEATLPSGVGHLPWRLTGIRLSSQRGELADFSHRVYLDAITARLADGSEALLEDFEAGQMAVWGASVTGFQHGGALRAAPDERRAASGRASLAVDYRIQRRGTAVTQPLLAINETGEAAVPLVISRGFAEYFGGRSRRAPLAVGDEDLFDLALGAGQVRFRYRVVGIVEDFPTLGAGDNFVIGRLDQLLPALNRAASWQGFYDRNQVWFELAGREPSPDFRAAIAALPGLTGMTYAWDRYNAIQRDPLANAVTGMLFAAFWVSLLLSALDFGFYLAVTARRRALSFAVLQAMGWPARSIWGVLAVEQTALVMPALLVGVGLGMGLAYLLLPFLELVGGQALRFPASGVIGLLAALIAVFAVLLGVTALMSRRQSVHQTLRLGEE